MGGFGLAAVVLESAIGAQLALLSAFLLSASRRGAALYLLAGLSAAMAALVAANLAIALFGWAWLGDPLLFLDLCAPSLCFLYVRQMNPDARPLRPLDAAHVLPAAAGLALWQSGLVYSVDAYVIGVWALYLAATLTLVLRPQARYEPAALRRFIFVLVGALGGATVLRVVMALQAEAGHPFREGWPYVLLLGALLLVTCHLLLTSLRYPNLLSRPGAYVKYAASKADAVDMAALERDLRALLRDKKPYVDADVTLAEIAVMLGAPARLVSQLVNDRLGSNVPALLNQYRVAEAARLLAADPGKPVKNVMYESGFRSKSIFNREFQRRMGKSPSAWRSSH